ncbi:MAG: hypothetical protein WDZ44_00155 [Candidatus Spechtbacterales bacterium]
MKQILAIILLFSFATGIITVGFKAVAPQLGISFGPYASIAPKNGSLMISTDGGVTWNKTETIAGSNSFVTYDIEYYLEGDQLVILAATSAGMLGSTDNGVTWSPLASNTIQGTVYDIAINSSPRRATIIVAGQNSSGYGAIFRSGNGGETFQQTYTTPSSGERVVGAIFDAGNSSRVVALTDNGSLITSLDSGFSWGTTLVGEGTGGFRELVRYPHEPNTLFAVSSSGLFKSSNRGTTWRSLQNELSQYPGATNINAIAVSPVAESMYLGTDYGILRSTNRGDSFQEIPFLVPASTIPTTAFATDPSSDSRAYAGVYQQMYETTDGGRSWQVAAVEGASYTMTFLSVNPTNTQILYAGFSN